jgi:hypothetical protein
MGNPYIYHKIEQGDTLQSIAKQYGVASMRLVKLNGGITNAGLKPGSYIIIGQIQSDTMDKTEQERQEMEQEEKEEAKEQQDESVKIPHAWLDDEDIRKMAQELVADNKSVLEALAGDKKRALQKIAEQRVDDNEQYYKRLRAINAGVEDKQSDFTQDAIKQGISRSSIVKSVNDEYRKQGDKQLGELDREASLAADALNNAQREIVRQYNQEVAESNKKYQQQLDNAMESIKKQNQDANIDLTVSNGIDNARQFEITDRLLGTLTKAQATDYLNRNKSTLIEAWGKDAVDKLYKKYR